ncbi:MAG: hypothetical protein FWG70_04135 [Oscillospiraceae bacterium]|nr:hypothetical protein [Oscillospiraceae bacterium]
MEFISVAPIILNCIMIVWQVIIWRKQKQLEAKLTHKTHISKARFDTEFQVYRDLSKAFWILIFSTCRLFPRLDHFPAKKGYKHTPDEEKTREMYIERYKNAIEFQNTAVEVLSTNAAFIDKSIFDMFENISKKCRQHIYDFDEWRLSKYRMSDYEYNQLLEIYRDDEDFKNRFKFGDKIYKEMQDLTEILRKHLDKLEMIN